MVIKDNAATILGSENALISTSIQNPIQASQHVPTIPTTANTFLLLTTRSKFDKTAFRAVFDNAKSSASHAEKPTNHHDQSTCHGERDGQDGKYYTTAIEGISKRKSLEQSVMVFNDS